MASLPRSLSCASRAAAGQYRANRAGFRGREGVALRNRLRGLYVIIDPAGRPRARPEVSIARDAIAGGALPHPAPRQDAREGPATPDRSGARSRSAARAGALFFINDHVDLALAVSRQTASTSARRTCLSLSCAGSYRARCSSAAPPTTRTRRAGPRQTARTTSPSAACSRRSRSRTRDPPPWTHCARSVPPSRCPSAPSAASTSQNIDDVIAAGADMVSVIAAVVAADDVREAARRLAGRFPA